MRNNKRERYIDLGYIILIPVNYLHLYFIFSFFLRKKKRGFWNRARSQKFRIENEIERNNADCFWELINRTFLCYCETFSKKVVSGCIDSLSRRFLNRAGISFAPATNLSNLLTEESGGSSLNRRTFVNCETTHARRRDKLVQFRHEILPFSALSKTKLNFLIITNERIRKKIVIPRL